MKTGDSERRTLTSLYREEEEEEEEEEHETNNEEVIGCYYIR